MRGALLTVVVFAALIICNSGDDEAEPTRPSTTTTRPTTTTTFGLTEREKECAAEFHPDLPIPEHHMIDLKKSPSVGRIHWWSDGYWVSYDKVMEVCDNRIFDPATTTPQTLQPSIPPTTTTAATRPAGNCPSPFSNREMQALTLMANGEAFITEAGIKSDPFANTVDFDWCSSEARSFAQSARDVLNGVRAICEASAAIARDTGTSAKEALELSLLLAEYEAWTGDQELRMIEDGLYTLCFNGVYRP